MTQPLFELDAELAQLIDILDSDEPEDIAAAEAILDDLMPQLAAKIDSYAGLIAHYERLERNIDTEIKRLTARKTAQATAKDRLKDRLQSFLESRSAELGVKGRKLEGTLYKVSLCANGGAQPIYINPIAGYEHVPEDLVQVTMTEKLITDKLREYMIEQNITEFFDGEGQFIAELKPRGSHLRIR